MQRFFLCTLSIAMGLGIGCENVSNELPRNHTAQPEPRQPQASHSHDPTLRPAVTRPRDAAAATFVGEPAEAESDTPHGELQTANDRTVAIAPRPAETPSRTTPPTKAAFTNPDSAEQVEDESSVTLLSGATVNLESLVNRGRAAFEQRIKEVPGKRRMLKLYYPTRTGAQSQQLHMFVGRKRGLVDGPMAAYYRDGAPMIYVAFAGRGERDGTLLAWDEEQRPVMLAQYESGERHGIRCLFKPCEVNCPKGHVSVVQEYSRGRLLTTHVVGDEDRMIAYDMTRPSELPNASALLEAIRDLNRFDDELGENERELRKIVASLHRQELQAAAETQAQANADRQRQAMAQAWMATVSRMSLAARMSATGCIGGG